MPALRDLMPKVWNRRGNEAEHWFSDQFPFFFGEKAMFNVDVKETEKEVIVEAELPGFEKDEIHVEIDDYSLAISAERESEEEEKAEKYFRRERQYGKVERVLPLPAEVISDSSKAKYDNGVLVVTLVKRTPSLPDRKSIKID
ncbi:MAG: Hsp20/alpha crystallin family protein [Ectobacillus sp.]